MQDQIPIGNRPRGLQFGAIDKLLGRKGLQQLCSDDFILPKVEIIQIKQYLRKFGERSGNRERRLNGIDLGILHLAGIDFDPFGRFPEITIRMLSD